MIQSIDLNGRFRPFLPLNRSAKDGYVAIFEDFVDVPAGMHRQPVFLVVTDSLGQMTDTLGRWPGKEFQAIDGGDDWMPVGFARTTLYAGSHGRSVLATTDSVDITLYSGQDRVLGIRGGRLPAETNDEDRQVWLDRYLGRFQGSAREMWRSRIDQSTIRETHPAFGALAIDDAGRIWLGDYADVHDNERTWTILSRHGRPIAQLQLPVYRPETIEVENTVRGYPTHELLSIIGDRIALLGRDELDVQYINVVQLVRKDVP